MVDFLRLARYLQRRKRLHSNKDLLLPQRCELTANRTQEFFILARSILSEVHIPRPLLVSLALPPFADSRRTYSRFSYLDWWPLKRSNRASTWRLTSLKCRYVLCLISAQIASIRIIISRESSQSMQASEWNKRRVTSHLEQEDRRCLVGENEKRQKEQRPIKEEWQWSNPCH